MTNDPTTEIRKLIDALSAGLMSLEEVAQKFREHRWIRGKPQNGKSDRDWLASQLDDAAPPTPGSFDDVSSAFHEHRITREQYRVLSEAAAEAMEAQDQADTE